MLAGAATTLAPAAAIGTVAFGQGPVATSIREKFLGRGVQLSKPWKKTLALTEERKQQLFPSIIPRYMRVRYDRHRYTAFEEMLMDKLQGNMWFRLFADLLAKVEQKKI